jgi:hypothetical protein
MKTSSLEELALLSDAHAVRKHFDAGNYRLLRLFFLVFAVVGLVWMGIWAADTREIRFLVVGLLAAGLNLWLLLSREKPFFERFFGLIVPTYAAVQLVLPAIALDSWLAPPVPIFVMIALLLLSLQAAEHILLFALLWFVLILGLGHSGALFDAVSKITACVLVFLTVALLRTQISRRRFLRTWRVEFAHIRERMRLREELESARRIQLGMLPHQAPDLGWVELAAASVPATEVGGDYYDYLRLGEDRLAVVIADVAGHGLAAALLLSGIRSCLYLLTPELASPVGVLERLTAMVRATTRRRTFVTLLVAVFDRTEGLLRVSAAGHPPALHWCGRTGAVTPIGRPAAALGTFVGSPYEEDQHPAVPGDLVVLYTDGLLEARNARGEEYGEERLRAVVTRAFLRGGAHEVRDAVLSDLSSFRGNAEPEDDFTVVAARLW